MNIYRAAEILRVPERRIVDFSNPVNPLGPSKKLKAELRKHLKNLKNLPDPDCARMKKHVARHLTVDADQVLCANGCTELIRILKMELKPQRILILAPSNPEYVKAVDSEREDHEVKYQFLNWDDNFALSVEAFVKNIDGCGLAFLSNPNNPTGGMVKRKDILDIAHTAQLKGSYLVVDESFIDFIPQETVVNAVRDNPYLIVLRSMDFFHSISGLKVGFGIMNADLIHKIKRTQMINPVNLLAQRAVVIALGDKAYRKESSRTMNEEKAFLEKELRKLGIGYFPSVANFYLLKVPAADKLYDFLFKRCILVRTCDDFKGLDESYIIIAVKGHRENTILIKSIRDYMSAYKQK